MLHCRSVRPAQGAFDAMLIGYARVSAPDQNPDQRIDALKSTHAKRLYGERARDGEQLPELDRALDALRADDTLLCGHLGRTARALWRERSMRRQAIVRHSGIGMRTRCRRFPERDLDAPATDWKRAA